jgi:hypothetical protein
MCIRTRAFFRKPAFPVFIIRPGENRRHSIPIAPLKSHYTFFHSFLFILSARVQIVNFLRRDNPALPENYLLNNPGREYQFWEPVMNVKCDNRVSHPAIYVLQEKCYHGKKKRCRQIFNHHMMKFPDRRTAHDPHSHFFRSPGCKSVE